MVDLRQPRRTHQGLEAHLVHAQRRRRDAAADVGHIQALEQPLHRPVLAVGAVQRREDDIGVEQPARRGQRQLAAVEQPAAFTVDLDGHCVVAPGAQAFTHRGGGGERDLMLGGASAAEHRDAHQVVPVGPLRPVGPVTVGPVGPDGPVGLGATYCSTLMITTLPGGTEVCAGGFCESTRPL